MGGRGWDYFVVIKYSYYLRSSIMVLAIRVGLVGNVYYKLQGSHFSKSKKTKHKKVLLIRQERTSEKGENRITKCSIKTTKDGVEAGRGRRKERKRKKRVKGKHFGLDV